MCTDRSESVHLSSVFGSAIAGWRNGRRTRIWNGPKGKFKLNTSDAKDNFFKNGVQNTMVRSGSNKCACGRGKYPDALSCSFCQQKDAPYVEEYRNSPNYCACGRGKIADASMCETCSANSGGYNDGRD